MKYVNRTKIKTTLRIHQFCVAFTEEDFNSIVEAWDETTSLTHFVEQLILKGLENGK